jgi:hypothetical protein
MPDDTSGHNGRIAFRPPVLQAATILPTISTFSEDAKFALGY